MSYLSEMYQAQRRTESNSVIYQPIPEQPKPRQIYSEGTYQGLGGYERRATSVTDRKAGESDHAYEARMSIWQRHVAAEGAEEEARQRAEQAALDVMAGRALDQSHGMFTSDDRQAYRDSLQRPGRDGQLAATAVPREREPPQC